MTSSASISPALQKPIKAGVEFGASSAFTVDVEEWFQVGAFETTLARDEWPFLESRVEAQTYKILEILAQEGIKATFFCLGWVAERHPLLIATIHKEGHEVACHGCDHRRLFTMDRDTFLADARLSKSQLEDATGGEVVGYRAPSFSLTPDVWWAYDCLAESGFAYSSSLYPVKTDHYGMAGASRRPFWPIGEGRILEVPMTVYEIAGKTLPASGGGYFRLLPYALGTGLFDRGARQTGTPGIFYMHPWEVDPDQPFVDRAPWLSRFRHYTGQAKMAGKVSRLIKGRNWARMKDIFLPPVSGTGAGA